MFEKEYFFDKTLNMTKMNAKLILALFFLSILIFCGCKKDNSKKDYYSGNYSFTTSDSGYPDSVMQYNGSISYDKESKILIVNYIEKVYTWRFPYTFQFVVDENGGLSYPEWTNQQYPSGHFFTGNIDYDGSIDFNIGWSFTRHGETYVSSRTVSGKKQ